MKPEVEYFFGVPYKCYCGKCGRILATGAVAIGQMKNWMEKACPWCGAAIDTAADAGNDQEEKHGGTGGLTVTGTPGRCFSAPNAVDGCI